MTGLLYPDLLFSDQAIRRHLSSPLIFPPAWFSLMHFLPSYCGLLLLKLRQTYEVKQQWMICSPWIGLSSMKWSLLLPQSSEMRLSGGLPTAAKLRCRTSRYVCLAPVRFRKSWTSPLDIYRVSVCSRFGCLHWPHSDPNLVASTDFPGWWLPHCQLRILDCFNSHLLQASSNHIPRLLSHGQRSGCLFDRYPGTWRHPCPNELVICLYDVLMDRHLYGQILLLRVLPHAPALHATNVDTILLDYSGFHDRFMVVLDPATINYLSLFWDKCW